jgi:hypothetical protein
LITKSKQILKSRNSLSPIFYEEETFQFLKSYLHIQFCSKFRQVQQLRAEDSDGLAQRQKAWMALVQEYSDRSLTQGLDKLSALSGLAGFFLDTQQMGKSPDSAKERTPIPRLDKYKAGLWKDTFIPELAWWVVKLGTAPKDALLYRAPSWSWASVDGAVRYEYHKAVDKWKYQPEMKINCTVEEVVCESILASDPMGPVKAAHAILTGLLAPVDLAALSDDLSEVWRLKDTEQAATYRSDMPSNQRALVRNKYTSAVEVFLDQPMKSCLGQIGAQSNCWIQGDCGKSCCSWENLNSIHGDNALFFCFQLFTWEASTGYYGAGQPSNMPPEVWFLVLKRSARIEAAFERIGVGVWDSWNHGRGNTCPLFMGCESSTVKII